MDPNDIYRRKRFYILKTKNGDQFNPIISSSSNNLAAGLILNASEGKYENEYKLETRYPKFILYRESEENVFKPDENLKYELFNLVGNITSDIVPWTIDQIEINTEASKINNVEFNKLNTSNFDSCWKYFEDTKQNILVYGCVLTNTGNLILITTVGYINWEESRTTIFKRSSVIEDFNEIINKLKEHNEEDAVNEIGEFKEFVFALNSVPTVDTAFIGGMHYITDGSNDMTLIGDVMNGINKMVTFGFKLNGKEEVQLTLDSDYNIISGKNDFEIITMYELVKQDFYIMSPDATEEDFEKYYEEACSMFKSSLDPKEVDFNYVTKTFELSCGKVYIYEEYPYGNVRDEIAEITYTIDENHIVLHKVVIINEKTTLEDLNKTDEVYLELLDEFGFRFSKIMLPKFRYTISNTL